MTSDILLDQVRNAYATDVVIRYSLLGLVEWDDERGSREERFVEDSIEALLSMYFSREQKKSGLSRLLGCPPETLLIVCLMRRVLR